MQWIALQWQPDDQAPTASAPVIPPSPETLGWWALQFTPRVAWLDEALMLEVEASERLWGGRQSLMRLMAAWNPAPGTRIFKAQGATGLVALARLRLYALGHKPPADVPSALPLHTLTAARDHLDVLARMGCRTWGDVARLPRGGLARRLGTPLREALDMAWGERPEKHTWLTLPDVFDQKLELPALAEGANELMWSANRLLAALQVWLRARQRGALALELQWTLDLKRYNGVDLPPHQHITVRTAEPTQDMAHLRRLMGERLALTKLAAPASWLRLRTLDTSPWAGASTSFLPEDNRKGDKLHELIERLSARLGAQQVQVPVALADHRPEGMQGWQPALRVALAPSPSGGGLGRARGKGAKVANPHSRLTSRRATRRPFDLSEPASAGSEPQVSAPKGEGVNPKQGADILPPWLLREPLRLEMRDGHPWYHGKLRRLVGPQRLEAGWWADDHSEGGHPAVRDYYVAESPGAGLVWVFRERSSALFGADEARWFLQGIYA